MPKYVHIKATQWMPGDFVRELGMFSKQFPAEDRAVVLVFEPWQNKLSG